MPTENFYSELPILSRFIDLTDSSQYVSVPDDWQVIITDIKGSTQAITSGKYKNINALGACSIVAILNVAQEVEIPFVFGGDGASILIPPSLLQEARQALLGVQDLAKLTFDLELRVGIVPVTTIKNRYDLKIAKLRISENYEQAVFKGGGLTYATQLVKDPATSALYTPSSEALQPNADFSGLECRWQDIPSRHGEILTLIVMATAPSNTQVDRIYREVIQQIYRIYGDDARLHPVAKENLNISFSGEKLLPETKIFTRSNNWLKQQLYILRLQIENLLGFCFMKFNMKVGDIDWGIYKKLVLETTDYKKFDDLLRMVISGNATQRQKLIDFLDKKFDEGRLVHGCHVSNRALMTCLVFERNGRQVHFIDGADGGYALAAKSMKERMQQ